MTSSHRPLVDEDQYETGMVYIGGLGTTILSPSDMVLPLTCGICIHLVYIALIVPIIVLLHIHNDSLRSCMDAYYIAWLYILLCCHVCILCISAFGAYFSLHTKSGGSDRCINVTLTIRATFNLCEVCLVLAGIYIVCIDASNTACWNQHQTSNGHQSVLYILSVLFLCFNASVLFVTWCCVCICIVPFSSKRTHSAGTEKSLVRRCCTLCLLDERANKVATSFYGMGGLINILSEGTRFTPAEVITGLHLLGMLQKHYGLLDSEYYEQPQHRTHYQPLAPQNSSSDKQLLHELEYFTLYSNAAYGIPLYSMTKPAAICCVAPPCLLPTGFDETECSTDVTQCDTRVLRQSKCCPTVQMDNASLKVFIERTKHDTDDVAVSSDVLLAAQFGGLHMVNFYVVADHSKQALVVAIRGTLSLGDVVTDANTTPHLCDAIHTDCPCYVHKGIGACAKYVFDQLMSNSCILRFARDEKYRHYKFVICGHSLGAGTTILLSLMMKYGRHDNLQHFINPNRPFKVFAISPPSCVDRAFALRKQHEIKKFLVCVIYGHDIVPRLSFQALIRTRAAINILLTLLNKTDKGPWWVYRKSVTVKKETILEALPADCIYCNSADSVQQESSADDIEYKAAGMDMDEAEEALLPKSSGHSCFMADVDAEFACVKQMYDEKLSQQSDADNADDTGCEDDDDEDNRKNNELLWKIKYCQVGDVIFITKTDNNGQDETQCQSGSECNECVSSVCRLFFCSIIKNACQCRCCLEPKDTRYKAYRASVDLFCDKILFSSNLMTHHMPHVVLDVLQHLNEESCFISGSMSLRLQFASAKQADQRAKDSVIAYINHTWKAHIASEKSLFCTVPDIIYALVVSYYFINEYFIVGNDERMTTDDEKTTVTGKNGENAFGYQRIHSMSSYIHHWKFKIVENHRLSHYITIGIVDADNIPQKKKFKDTGFGYGLCGDGDVYSVESTSSFYQLYNCGQSYVESDIVHMILDVRERRLSFQINQDKLIHIENIKVGPHVSYKMALHLASNESVRLVDSYTRYSDLSTELTSLLVSWLSVE